MREHEFEVDRAAAAAWRGFQAALADRLAALEEGDVAVVEAMVGEEPEAGAAPYVQFCAFDEGMLRGEVASNHVLDERWELDAAAVAALGELGFAAPTYGPEEEADHGSLNHYVDVARADADRLAVMATRALRDVFGVAHPALLCGDVADEGSPPVEGAAAQRGDEPVAEFPHGHEELSAMVDRALAVYLGHEPRHDSDGDIPVVAGLGLFFVRVVEDVPVIELFGCVATDVTDLEAARREVEILNRDVRMVKFRLSGDSIMVDLQLPAWPFVPEHLRAMVTMLVDVMSGIEDDLVARVGGRHVYDPRDEEACDGDEACDGEACDDDGADGAIGADDDRRGDSGLDARVARAAAVLAELEADRRGSVDPALAASICGHDAAVILELLAPAVGQERGWREARDEAVAAGDEEDVAPYDAELRRAAATTRVLRRALRVVVERDASRESSEDPRVVERGGDRGRGERPRRRPTRPARAARPRTFPDPTIEEVDPDIWG